MELVWKGVVGAAQLIAQGDALVVSAAWRSIWIAALAVALASLASIPFGVFLALARFPGRTALLILTRTGMSIPTVLIGLLCYAMFSRRGPLGGMELLYTTWGIGVGHCLLAAPIVASWTQSAVSALDSRVAETAKTLGASRLRCGWTCLYEARSGILLALLTAFARCFTELGIAVMVGGNIKHHTRTLTTATALETARGEFDRGVAMSLILLAIAVVVTVLIAVVSSSSRLESNQGVRR